MLVEHGRCLPISLGFSIIISRTKERKTKAGRQRQPMFKDSPKHGRVFTNIPRRSWRSNPAYLKVMTSGPPWAWFQAKQCWITKQKRIRCRAERKSTATMTQWSWSSNPSFVIFAWQCWDCNRQALENRFADLCLAVTSQH